MENGKTVDIELTAGQAAQGRFILSKVNPYSGDRQLEMTVFPNPAKDRLHVQFPSNGPVLMTIVAISGARILQKTVSPDNGLASGEFDLTGLKAGVYLVDVEVNGIRKVSKFIKF